MTPENAVAQSSDAETAVRSAYLRPRNPRTWVRPADQPFTSGTHTLYRFWDARGRLLYVGITAVGTQRWFQHARTKRWWPDISNITLEHFATRLESLEAEAVAIRTEHPLYNIQRGKRPRPNLADRPQRRHGTGSVFQRRKTGEWIALMPAALGRRSKYFRSKEEAIAWLDAELVATGQTWTHLKDAA